MSDHQLQTILERVSGGLDPSHVSSIGPEAMQQLNEAEGNPRTISASRYADLLWNLNHRPELLEARPIVVDAELGDVPCGNMRLRAGCELLRDDPEGGLAAYVSEHGFPLYVKKFADANERREWLTLDNQPFGEWVPDELAGLVALHKAEGGAMRGLGFSEAETQGLLLLGQQPPAAQGAGDPDDVPEPPAQARTRPGDAYWLGRHLLLCADAGHPQSYSRLLDLTEGRGWDMVWTDPPYGVGYSAEERISYFSPERLAKPFGEIEGDAKQEVGAYAEWLAEVLALAGGPLREGGAVYLCHADKMVEAAARSFREAGLYLSSQLLWLKTVLVFGRSDYHYKHEPILYGWKQGAAHRWLGDRKQTTVFEVSSDHYGEDRESYVHPTQKPYDLIRPHIENSSEPGDVVLDPFGGSGSTLVTAHRLSRTCVTMELEPRYCDVIVQRFKEFAPDEEVGVVPLNARAPA